MPWGTPAAQPKLQGADSSIAASTSTLFGTLDRHAAPQVIAQLPHLLRSDGIGVRNVQEREAAGASQMRRHVGPHGYHRNVDMPDVLRLGGRRARRGDSSRPLTTHGI